MEPTFVSDDTKNGMIMAIGIILGFALTFFGQWCLGNTHWEPRHIPTAVIQLLGILVLIASLYNSLVPARQTERHYKTTVRVFVVGIVFVLFGFVTGVEIMEVRFF